jgi:chromosome segregation ATPase
VSRYRDELDAAKTRAAVLEEDLEAREEVVEEQAARIAELEGKLARVESRKPKRRTAEEHDEQPVEDGGEPVRRRLVKLHPKGMTGSGILALVLLMLVLVGFLIMVTVAR